MDFGGMVGMEGLACVSSEGGSLFSPSLISSSRQRGLLGSCFQKNGRSAETEDFEWRSSKMARSEAMLVEPLKTAPFLLGSNSRSPFPGGEQMLSFSSASKQDALMLSGDGTLPYYNHSSASSSAPVYLRNAGLYSGSSNMHGVLARVRGPFTPSQWLELEHQALIYKYIVANAPIPASLLIPIKRSISGSGFTPYATGTFGSVGWGSFHLGYPGNADPEPGRCRRTDGKKWRCSRDAVADQKYCERHMNRGRHRSRKHVEGHNGHAAKAMPVIAATQSASAVSGGGSSSLSIAQQHNKNTQSNATNPCPAQFNRMMMSKEDANDHGQDSESLSMIASVGQNPISTLFPLSKQHSPFEPSPNSAKFGLISSDSLLNPPSGSSDNIGFVAAPKFNDQQTRTNPLRHFIDNWPKTLSDRSTITWPDVDEMHSDRTQLSISIPKASSDFSSSSSPNHEKLTLSPLKLSREYDPIHMGLGVGVLNEVNLHKASWIPISWEASMAGPLGEVLTNTNSTPKDQSKNCSTSSLNLLTDGWDSSPRLESSPSGVLQKTSFDSLSSSTRSSPRTENHKNHESSGSLCDDLIRSTFVNPPTIPSV